ncbi:hypothetical protein HPB48_022529 [Haemaphysalis longicornis]|uniref:Transposable element P transposase n=1 Tax=Haemaphysalis longicornis TaxID=44386 RepID=A0A9J6G8T7_HAELO|nr:hypothetical protein HPB48_022529 [Haemaphysalis longicornis]
MQLELELFLFLDENNDSTLQSFLNRLCSSAKKQHKAPSRPTKAALFFSDFPHLIKNVRNGFVSKGYMTPSGHVHCGIIEVAWKADCEHVTLKAMPSITQAHIKPNSFEKMKVDLAFQLFGDQVIKGIFLHKEKINSVYRTVQPTEEFLLRFNRLIRVMTSRTSDTALRPKRGNQQFLEEFLNHLDAWEECTKTIGGGFLSESTAAGLRVTVKSTLDLLTYLSTTEGFKYLLTCRLSQDKLENFFGIIRLSAGCNDHPTVSQFLVTVNLMTFYNLAKSPRGGNCASGVVKALLSPASLKSTPPKNLLVSINDLLEKGRVDEAEEIIDSAVARNDHSSYTEKRSHSALTYYVHTTLLAMLPERLWRRIVALLVRLVCAQHKTRQQWM